jgi:tRNA-Thr(GGU) m(6)t(6)A37 methyltransferase TsaA
LSAVAAEDGIREGEVAVDPPVASDAGLVFIGRIRTPWTSREQTPRQGSHDGPLCRIELFEPWLAGLAGIAAHDRLEVLYWLDRSRRDLVLQRPAHHGELRGVFALRSPVRPNPIGTSIVKLERVAGGVLEVRGLDCLDGTPLLDLKPDRCPMGAAPPSRRTAAP